MFVAPGVTHSSQPYHCAALQLTTSALPHASLPVPGNFERGVSFVVDVGDGEKNKSKRMPANVRDRLEKRGKTPTTNEELHQKQELATRRREVRSALQQHEAALGLLTDTTSSSDPLPPPPCRCRRARAHAHAMGRRHQRELEEKRAVAAAEDRKVAEARDRLDNKGNNIKQKVCRASLAGRCPRTCAMGFEGQV